MVCLILQKQIEHIDGKKENIIIPSLRLKQIRERNGTDYICILSILISCVDSHRHTNIAPGENVFSSSCALCSTEDNRLTRIPCCHLLLCNNCAHSKPSNLKSGDR